MGDFVDDTESMNKRILVYSIVIIVRPRSIRDFNVNWLLTLVSFLIVGNRTSTTTAGSATSLQVLVHAFFLLRVVVLQKTQNDRMYTSKSGT